MRVRNMTTCALGFAAALTLRARSRRSRRYQPAFVVRRSNGSRSKAKVACAPASERLRGPGTTTVSGEQHDRSRGHRHGDSAAPNRSAEESRARCSGASSRERTWPYGQHRSHYTNGFHGGGVRLGGRRTARSDCVFDGAMSQTVGDMNGLHPDADRVWHAAHCWHLAGRPEAEGVELRRLGILRDRWCE